MKVLHVFDQTVPCISGYASRSQYIVESQKKIGIEPIVVSSPRFTYENERDEFNEIPYFRSKLKQSLLGSIPIVNNIILMNCLELKIQKIAQEANVDVIHAHSPVICGLPALKVAQRIRVPFVYEVRALWEDAAVDQGKTYVNSMRYKLTRLLETYLLRNAHIVVTICEGLKEEIIKRKVSVKRIVVVPNGVDCNKFIPTAKDVGLLQKYGINESDEIIGFIGSFYEFEGVKNMIEAMNEISTRTEHIKMMIVGGGIEEANLKQLTKNLRLEDRVIFTGKVPHKDILRYYSLMDVLVYPRQKKRITEMVTPIKPLEAMALEKAVIGSDVGGIKELISDGKNGLLFESGNVLDLSKTILKLLMNKSLKVELGKNARLSVLGNRSWSNIILKYRTIYEAVVKNKGYRE